MQERVEKINTSVLKEILNSHNSCEPQRLMFQNDISNDKPVNHSTFHLFNFVGQVCTRLYLFPALNACHKQSNYSSACFCSARASRTSSVLPFAAALAILRLASFSGNCLRKSFSICNSLARIFAIFNCFSFKFE